MAIINDYVDKIQICFGFNRSSNRKDIAKYLFESFEDIMSLNEKDVGNLFEGFLERTEANGRIVFVLRLTNLLKSTVHWVEYFQSIIRYPTLGGIEDKSTLKGNIDSERVLVGIRKHNSDESDSLSKSVEPENIKKKNYWILWSQILMNYLSTILGHNGVPLSYVISLKPDPNYDEEYYRAYYFEQLYINCDPLYILVYKTDAHKLHQLIHIFVQGGTADTCIKPRGKKLDGVFDFKSLQAHYRGKVKAEWIKSV